MKIPRSMPKLNVEFKAGYPKLIEWIWMVSFACLAIDTSRDYTTRKMCMIFIFAFILIKRFQGRNAGIPA